MNIFDFPRRIYTQNPTPIEHMKKLSEKLNCGVNLYIKRDDMLGLAGGGNKTRKLEFAMADALQQGADTVVTCGAVQSNHCRLTLSACIKEGLKCCLVIEERVSGSYDPAAGGNNYLFHLMGAERIIKVGLGQTRQEMETLSLELQKGGRNVYIIPGGASNEIGSMGYVSCASEINDQQIQLELPSFDAWVTASGSGGTQSGLVVGNHLSSDPTRVIGISTGDAKAQQEERIGGIVSKLSRRLGVPTPPSSAIEVLDQYVGEGYSIPTKPMIEAVTLFAQYEAVLLDPVYSGKGAAGLLDLVRNGTFREGANVLFLHTGGAPSLYYYLPTPSPSVS